MACECVVAYVASHVLARCVRSEQLHGARARTCVWGRACGGVLSQRPAVRALFAVCECACRRGAPRACVECEQQCLPCAGCILCLCCACAATRAPLLTCCRALKRRPRRACISRGSSRQISHCLLAGGIGAGPAVHCVMHARMVCWVCGRSAGGHARGQHVVWTGVFNTPQKVAGLKIDWWV